MADYIYVMRNGRIAEEGSFDDLLTKRGIFKSMYDAQKL
jgi:ABC-type multidrug transport system fused ATPase/permease subunit